MCSLGVYSSGGGKDIGLSSSLSLVKDGMSPRHKGSRVTLLCVKARVLSDVMFVMPSGMVVMRLRLRSSVCRPVKRRIWEGKVSTSHWGYIHVHAGKMR